MKRLLLLALLAAAGCAPSEVLPPHGKPSPPIDLDVRVVGRTDPGVPFGLIVRAKPKTDGDVQITVSLPDGVIQKAGTAGWKGRLRANEVRELRLDLAGTGGASQKIMVVAEMIVDGKTKLARCESVTIEESPAAPPGTPRTNAAGEGILDFQY